MHSGRAGSNHHPIDTQFSNILLDEILSRVGTKIAVIPGYRHARKRSKELSQSRTINCGGNIGAAVTDVDPDLLVHENGFLKGNGLLFMSFRECFGQ
jgi:hypothetical protein